jgi:hypothetical protein
MNEELIKQEMNELCENISLFLNGLSEDYKSNDIASILTAYLASYAIKKKLNKNQFLYNCSIVYDVIYNSEP